MEMVVIKAERFGSSYCIIAEREYVKRRIYSPSGFRPLMGTETLYWAGDAWVGSRNLDKAEQFTDVEAAEEAIDHSQVRDTLPEDWQDQVDVGVVARPW
jgi:hypothetical protein